MSRGQVPLTCSQANKQKILYERCDSNMSLVQKEVSKIMFIDETGESTVGWNDVIGEGVPNFDYSNSEKELIKE